MEHAAAVTSTTDPTSQALVALLLAALFIVLAFEKAHRVLVVLTAVAVLWTITYLTPWHLLTFEAAARALDLNVLLLLAGMMALVGVLKETGVFAWAVDRIVSAFGDRPVAAITIVWWFTAVASAFVDNVTTVIFVTPIVLATIKRLNAPALPVLLPMIMAANIGGTATLIGDPPNIMIGSGAGLTFVDFIVHLAVPVALMMVGLHWWGAHRLRQVMTNAPLAVDAVPDATITDPGLLRWMAAISTLVLVGFLTHGATGMPAAVPAVLGAAAALLVQDIRYLRTHRPSQEERQHGILHVLEREIEWPTLVFFAFLFILVGAAVETGLIATFAHWLESGILAGRDAFGLGERGTLLLAALLVLWVAGALSALMDNIPFVAVSIPVIGAIVATLPGETGVLWWALSLGACLGGNGSPIGASANVTTLGLAERGGVRITFGEFVRTGAKVTLFTLVVSTAFLAAFVMVDDRTARNGGIVLLGMAAVFAALRRRRARRA